MRHLQAIGVRALFAALALGISAGSLEAGVIISDGFEDPMDIAGGSPVDWTVTNGAAGNVWHRVDAAAQSPFNGGADSKGVAASDDRTTATATLLRGFGAPQTSPLTISFDFRFTGLRVTAANNNEDYVFQLRDSAGAVALQLFLSDALDDVTRTATVASLTPQGTRQALGAVAQDAWYRLRVATGPAGTGVTQPTFDVAIDQYVSGSEAAGDLVTAPVAAVPDVPMFAGVNDYAEVRFTAADNAGAVSNAYLGGKHLDNVRVSTVVPDPGVASAAGAVLALLCRRRRSAR